MVPDWRHFVSSLEDKKYALLSSVSRTAFSLIHLIHKTVLSNYKAIAKKIGVPASRLHDLRHTFAVLSLQNGDSIKTLQENLGHATASFTMQTYAHVSDRMKKESADKMETYITEIAMRA